MKFTNIFFKKRILKQFAAFLLAGFLRVPLTFFLYYSLVTYISVHPNISLAIVFLVSVPLALFLHKGIVFSNSLQIFSALPTYYKVFSLSFLINQIILYVFCELCFFDPIIVQLFAIVGLAGFNYIFLARWVERNVDGN